MKAKDNIEEIILNNLKELNDFEPQEGHFERFQTKLNASQKKRTITLSLVWKVAAAVVFVLLATNQAFIYFAPNKTLPIAGTDNEFTLASVSPEYKEVEFYFTNAINDGLNQWDNLKNGGFISEADQKLLDNELAEFEVLYNNLQIDLQANPNDERVINAMLEYYQAKLEIINMIVDKLQEVRKQSTKKSAINPGNSEI